MKALEVARVSLRRVARDRTALFFMLVLPVFVILIVGATVRGFSSFHVGVVDLGAGPQGRSMVAALEADPHLDVRSYADETALGRAVARGEVGVGVVLPARMDEVVREGGVATVGLMAERANTTQQAAATAVSAVIAGQGVRVQAAQFATAQGGGTFDENLQRARSIEPRTAQVEVVTAQAAGASAILPEGFSYSAPTMLVLFVFLNAVAGGASIVETRRLGLYERMAAAPVRVSSIIVGETLAFGAVALAQSVIIVAVGAWLFGVSWGSPPAAAALVVVWSLVGAGAGMLAGSLFRTPEQATAIGPVVGIVFGMLGGCMWPLAIVSQTFRSIGHAVPHAWAVDAWTDLLSRGATIGAIAVPLGVLAAFAALFLALATLRLRRVLA